MLRNEIISKIESQQESLGLTILRSERFKKHPLKASYFYLKVACNRYTPLSLPIGAKTIWGHSLYAYETSAIGSVYFLGFYDNEVTLFLLKNFSETGDLLDVGSNIGYYTSLFTQIASPDAKIIAFEPTPSTYGVLIKNVSKLPGVKTEEIALSDHSGTITFYDYGIRHGVYNSTAKQPIPFLKNAGASIEVPTETLDEWCLRTNTKPSLIKLDTEGTEASILEHGRETLKNYSPIILLEVGGGEAWGENANRCLDILTEHKYSFYELDSLGNPIPHQRLKTYSYNNLICIPESKIKNYVKST